MVGAIGKGRIYGTTAQQRYVYATKFFAVIVYLGYLDTSKASPRRAPYTPRRCEGGRSPRVAAAP